MRLCSWVEEEVLSVGGVCVLGRWIGGSHRRHLKPPILLALPLVLTVLLPSHLKMSDLCVSMCVRKQHCSDGDTEVTVTVTGSTRRGSTDNDITRPLMTAPHTHANPYTHACVPLVQTQSDQVGQDHSYLISGTK